MNNKFTIIVTTNNHNAKVYGAPNKEAAIRCAYAYLDNSKNWKATILDGNGRAIAHL